MFAPLGQRPDLPRPARYSRRDGSDGEIDSPWLFDGENSLLVNGVDALPLVDAELNRRFRGRLRLLGLVNIQVAPAASSGWPTSASSSCAAAPCLVWAATTIPTRLRPW
jgi:hypothetical protein